MYLMCKTKMKMAFVLPKQANVKRKKINSIKTKSGIVDPKKMHRMHICAITYLYRLIIWQIPIALTLKMFIAAFYTYIIYITFCHINAYNVHIIGWCMKTSSIGLNYFNNWKKIHTIL